MHESISNKMVYLCNVQFALNYILFIHKYKNKHLPSKFKIKYNVKKRVNTVFFIILLF